MITYANASEIIAIKDGIEYKVHSIEMPDNRSYAIVFLESITGEDYFSEYIRWVYLENSLVDELKEWEYEAEFIQ